MTLKDISLLNLRRRKGKAFFVLAGLLIGVTTVVALMTLVGAMTEDINHKLEKFGANILVVPKTENLGLTYGGLSLGGVSFEMEEIHEAELTKISTIPNSGNVAAVGPMVLGVLDVSGTRVLLSGVDFESTNILKPWWKIAGSEPGENGLLLGAEASRILGLAVGDTVETGGRTLVVSGILEPTGSQDDQLAFAKLGTAQALLGKEGRVSMVEVAALCKDCPIEDMVMQISGVLPGANVMAIQSVVKGRMQTLAQFRKLTLGVSFIVVLVGSLVVLVTMMGSVRERTREIGIFRAIGYRKSHVMRIVLIEAVLISALAGVIGYPLGLGATKAVIPLFTESVNVAIPMDPMLIFGAPLAAILLGLAASVYPALIAAGLDPNDALRYL
jgi:putative ABC transport system permease protein